MSSTVERLLPTGGFYGQAMELMAMFDAAKARNCRTAFTRRIGNVLCDLEDFVVANVPVTLCDPTEEFENLDFVTSGLRLSAPFVIKDNALPCDHPEAEDREMALDAPINVYVVGVDNYEFPNLKVPEGSDPQPRDGIYLETFSVADAMGATRPSMFFPISQTIVHLGI